MNTSKKISLLLATSLTLGLTIALPVSANATAQQTITIATPKKPFTDNYVGELQTVTAKYEDTLVHIGRDYDVGFVEMRAANPHLDPWIPGVGAPVIIPTMHLLPDAPRDSVVINLAEMRMYFYKTPGQAPQTYPIGIGRDGLLTPVGTTTVTRKKAGPTWTPTPRMRSEDPTLPPVVPPGPDNPMGTHALYLGFPQVAIHGTNKPYGIGRRVSSGCIRMFPEDIGRVFDQVPVGAKITVVDQPIKAAWIGNKFYLEVHPTQAQATMMEKEGAIPDYELSERDLAYIMKKAGAGVEKLDWAAIRKVVKERNGYPIAIAEGTGVASHKTPITVVTTTPDPAAVKTVVVKEKAIEVKKTPLVKEASADKTADRKPFYRNN